MKNLSRLTALLLALVMLLSIPASATEGVSQDDLTRPLWDEWVQDAENQAASTPRIITGGEVIDQETADLPADVPAYEITDSISLAQNAAGSETEQAVILYRYGKVVLDSGIADGQWQVLVGEQWINVSGETASSFEVTYAKVESLFAMNGYAKVRCISAGGALVSDIANIGISYESQTLPLAEDELLSSYSMASANDGIVLAAEEGAEEDPETVIIEIAYRYLSGETVATSYTAEIEKGSDLTTAVIALPQIQGYVASEVTPDGDEVNFVAPSGDEVGSVQLELSNVTTDLVYVVTYVPTYVDYTVKHFLMGFDAEQSTAVEQTDDTVVSPNAKKTGESVGTGLENAYEGYTALWYDSTTKVAADGSTVINIYYERNWYLMLFDLGDGAYGVEPIYAQYGAAISVGTPTRPGYTFLGWSEDGTNVITLPATMPAANKTYKAVWQAAETAKVSVVIWGENADDEGYSYIESTEITATTGSTIDYETAMTVCGETSHQHADSCYACEQEEHAHTSECYSCGTEEHSHSRSCYTATGGTLLNNAETNNDWLNRLNNATANSDGIYTVSSNRETRYYVKIGSSYYRVTLNGRQDIDDFRYSSNCGKTEHAHSDSCNVSCGKTVHTHSTTCGYDCGMTEHTHTDDCYLSNTMDTDLWTYVRSDTVTVAADGSTVMNVYYDRVEFSLTFYDGNSKVYEIKEKWGASISEHWPIVGTNGTTYDNGERWDPNGSSTYSEVLVYLDIMPAESFSLSVSRVDYDTFNMHYMLEALPDETEETVSYTYNNTTKEFIEGFSVSANYNHVTEDEDFFDIEGFSQWTSNPRFSSGRLDIDGGGDVYMYYSRNSYTLDFNDGYSVVKSESVLYDDTLDTYEDYVPSLPAAYEAGSRVFAGWYLNPECSGDMVILDETHMPADNMILYAKWVLVEHDVTFYTKQEDITSGTALVPTFQVTHYDTVKQTVEDNAADDDTTNDIAIPTKAEMEGKNGNYKFVGWFYMDTVTNEDGTTTQVEKAFDPDTMPVVKDLVVYGKWSANLPVTYTIHYYLADENGNPVTDEGGNYIPVADDFVGEALNGVTVTVEAKTGIDLYDNSANGGTNYQVGHFPKPPSHSVEIDITEDKIEYIFWYVPADKVPYKVVYLIEQEDGSYVPYGDGKLVEDNTNVVVTENYLRIPGYMPDAFQKRLIVSEPGTTVDNGNNKTDAELGENIIFFYYHKDTENALWSVSHFIEPAGGSDDLNTWQQYGITESQTGKINTEYTATPKNITGFVLKVAYVDNHSIADGETTATTKTTDVTATLKSTLTNGGMDFRLYYEREEYPIKVQYLEEGTNTALADAVLYNNGEKYDYQSLVSVSTDKTFLGYDLVSTNPQTLTIQVDGTELDDVTKNVITFYYKKAEIEINYVGVAPDGTLITTDEQKKTIGSVSPEAEPGTNGVVTALDGPVDGSTATAVGPTYKFVGWYLDPACTQPVPTDWVTVSTITPQTEDADDNPETTGDLLFKTATYYAKFEYNLTDLTITKTGANETLDPDACFIFTVTGDGITGSLQVVIKGNGSVTIEGLTVGATYTVTEAGGWSWRYTATCVHTDGKITLVPEKAANVITFSNARTEDKWIDSDCYAENNFGSASN